MKKELQIPQNEEIQQMRQFTGEQTMQSENLRIPYLNFNGKTGKFAKITGKDEKGKNTTEEIGNEIQAVILRVRKILQSGMEDKQELYTREFDSYQDRLELYEKGTKEPIETNFYPSIKMKFNLKLTNILYIFYENTIYKLRVPSGSLNSLWSYLQSFGNNDTVLRYITTFNSKDEANDKGFRYKQMTFSKEEETKNWKEIWENLKILDKNISKTAEKHIEILEPEKESEIPTIQIENEENEVNTDEIVPF